MKKIISIKPLTLLLSIFVISVTAFAQQSKATKKVIIVLSAADTWTRANGAKYPTGYWTEEFVDVHKEFVEAGYTVHIATPRAEQPTADPLSLEVKTVGTEKATFLKKYLASLSKTLSNPLSLDKINMQDYDAVIIPGGHGPVEDLYKDKDMGKVLFAAEKSKKIIGAVCHGQAALLSAFDNKGNWLFKGRNMTSFSDAEEIEFGTADNAPWLLASTLRKYGANYTCGKNWSEYIKVDGNLVTGQNPASSIPMAKAIIDILKESPSLQ
ncbi:type 1 glutamine amidotransferase domain-containing protein [Niastella caeni]|uniref:Type 1 glutamine amidotransferase domain-containing protein n=1 Tax=Niastella caeni TaxID=2569763 RepID=A0A4S8HUA6_9BACT|nr:type 1 glutamine amidotransferase domain-containing protein [Niastella caeni]THU39218.1 type 1 glutamine amidotransferase domain-containing protein [Niastella caeni]